MGFLAPKPSRHLCEGTACSASGLGGGRRTPRHAPLRGSPAPNRVPFCMEHHGASPPACCSKNAMFPMPHQHATGKEARWASLPPSRADTSAREPLAAQAAWGVGVAHPGTPHYEEAPHPTGCLFAWSNSGPSYRLTSSEWWISSPVYREPAGRERLLSPCGRRVGLLRQGAPPTLLAGIASSLLMR